MRREESGGGALSTCSVPGIGLDLGRTVHQDDKKTCTATSLSLALGIHHESIIVFYSSHYQSIEADW